MRWYRKAAEQGHVTAQSNLGSCYYDLHDYREAVTWLRKAAEQGNATAQYLLGCCYYLGKVIGVSRQSFYEGVRWLRLAAQQGLPQAQKNLDDIAREGLL